MVSIKGKTTKTSTEDVVLNIDDSLEVGGSAMYVLTKGKNTWTLDFILVKLDSSVVSENTLREIKKNNTKLTLEKSIFNEIQEHPINCSILQYSYQDIQKEYTLKIETDMSKETKTQRYV